MGACASTSPAAASASVSETNGKLTGTHEFTIRQYSRTKGIGVGNSIVSRSFAVGRRKWRLRFFPDGYNGQDEAFVAFNLETVYVPQTAVYVEFSFELLDRDGAVVFGQRSAKVSKFSVMYNSWGLRRFHERQALEASPCVHDDSITVRCTVHIIKKQKTYKSSVCDIPVPPSSYAANFHRLLDSIKVPTDVMFDVGGRTFKAHRLVLAAQSPVFRAELYGTMKEGTMQRVKIDGTSPEAFQGVLHFVYSDSMPPDKKSRADATAAACKLFEAADVYGLERLKMMCAEKLCGCIADDTVRNIWELADLHSCAELKLACNKYVSQFCRIVNACE